MSRWIKGIALDGRKHITDKYLIWRTENPKPSNRGYNIIVSKYPKFVNVKISKEGYYIVLERWWLGSKDSIIAEGLSKSNVVKITRDYMKKH